MPSTNSNHRRKFMWIVYGIQTGKIPATKVGEKAAQAAKGINPSDVKDYLMQEFSNKDCGMDIKQRIYEALKEIQEPMMLEDEQATPNVLASTKTYHGDFNNTLKMYRGFELTPKENQAIQSFDEVDPTAHDKFKVQYSKSDDYGNTSTVVVKKLRDPTGKFCFVALTKVRSGQEEEPTDPETPTPPDEQGAQPPPKGQPPTGEPPLKEGDDPSSEEIKIIKSVPIEDSDGSQILTNFLQAVYHQQA